MINITNPKARSLYVAEFSRQMIALENIFIKEIRPVLNRQYFDAAKLVKQNILYIDFSVDDKTNRLINRLFKHYKRTARVFGNKAFKIIENSKSIDIPEIKSPKDEFWRSMNTWMTSEAGEKISKINASTKRNINAVIQRGLNDGISHIDIAKNIRKNGLITNRTRAITISRTETHTVAVRSVDESVRSTRIEMEREWVSAKDLRTRTFGRGNAFEHFLSYPAGPDGERVSQDGFFQRTGEPMKYPGDPRGSAGNVVRCRCFPEDTKIFGTTPIGATRQWYDGELIEITTALGHKLSATPNHPILTMNGNVGIGSLNNGDSVFSSSLVNGMTLSHPDIKDIDTVIGEIYNTFSNLGTVNRVPSVNVNFHGQIPDKYVNVISVNGSLRNAIKTKIVDPFNELEFTSTNLAKCFAPSNSLFNMFINWSYSSFGSNVGRDSHFFSFLLCQLGYSVEHSFRLISMLESGFFKGCIDKSSVSYTKGFCNSLDRHIILKHFYNLFAEFLPSSFAIDYIGLSLGSFDSTLIDKAVNSHSRTSNLLGDAFTRKPGLIQLDSIIDIKRRFFSGHVYNLHDKKGFYVANGLLVSNCVIVYHTIRRTVNLKPHVPETDPEIPIKNFESSIAGNKFETAAVFKLNGEKIFEKKGKKSSVSFTPDEVKKMKNNILTHNHPFGVSFSRDDLNMVTFGGLKSIRAVNKKENVLYKLDIKDPSKYFKSKIMQSEVSDVWDLATKQVRRKFLRLINEKKLTINGAQKIHDHEVMKKVVKFLKSDFTYEKIEGIF